MPAWEATAISQTTGGLVVVKLLIRIAYGSLAGFVLAIVFAALVCLALRLLSWFRRRHNQGKPGPSDSNN